MDAKLDGLIEKIKSEGIEEAKKSSEAIITKAKEEARQILAKAQKEAASIVETATKESEKLQANAVAALKQAERDTILTTKEKLSQLFDKVFKQEIAAAASVDFLKDLITKMVESTAGDQKMEFLVGEKDLAKLQDLVLGKAKAGLKDQVTFKVDKGVSSGFRVGLKGDNVFYDFTDQSISEFLGEFLSPSINELLSK